MATRSLNPPIVISGLGVITPAGVGIEPLWNAAFEQRTLIQDGVAKIATAREPVALAQSAIELAMSQSGWSSLEPTDGLVVGTTVGQTPLWETEIQKFSQGKIDSTSLSKALQRQPLGAMTESLAERLNHTGPSLLVSSACSASTQALGLALLWLRQERVKRCIVGGVEVLSQLTLQGFRSLQLLSPSPATPFDQNRQGINLSEASVFLCLERASDRPLAYLSGCGFSTDAYHMASPHPEGNGSYAAMEMAIRIAGLKPGDISWVHAHGTGSMANDLAEGKAITRLCGDVYASSTKWVHGHALGASGALETAICVESIRRQTILRTPGLQNPDPAIGIRHPERHLQTEVRHILKNTLGFGGNNAAVVISSPGAYS